MVDATDNVNPDAEEEFSLASLADLDVSDIAEVRFESLPAGVYDFEVVEADLNESEKDGEKIFYASFALKVVECKAAMEPDVDKDSLEGKIHKHRQNINPQLPQADVVAAIGRVRAFITDIGMDSNGTLGAIVAEAKGQGFQASIVKTKDKTDPSIEYANLRFKK